MAKVKSMFVCQNCGFTYPKWQGRCDNCGDWNSLVEQMQPTQGKSAVAKSIATGNILTPQTIGSISAESVVERMNTEFDDLNLVLGGGILSGGVILIAGQPGIGKSTLLLQIANSVSKKRPVLYVSGEESASQVKLRAERLGASGQDQLHFVASTSADDIAATIRSAAYDLVIVDSIQTLSLA